MIAESQEQESGLCECGCGQWTKVAPFNSQVKGWVRGQHFRFVHGHASRMSRTESSKHRPPGSSFGNYKAAGTKRYSSFTSPGSLERNMSILSESFILPEQWRSGSPDAASGERKLVLVLLEGALLDLRFLKSRLPANLRIGQEAKAWLEGAPAQISLLACLSLLNIDPDRFKERVKIFIAANRGEPTKRSRGTWSVVSENDDKKGD